MHDMPPIVAPGGQMQPPPIIPPLNLPTSQIPPPSNQKGKPTVPAERSLTHNHMINKKAVYMSCDIETGGEYCGILQISAEVFRLNLMPGRNKGKDKAFSKRKDTAEDIVRDPNTFNKYIKPGDRAIWSEQATKIHGLHEHHQKIMNADPLSTVWRPRWSDDPRRLCAALQCRRQE